MYASAVPILESRIEAERLAVEGARLDVEGRLGAAADLLVRVGAGRVFLFGSLAWGGFHRDSDVDLAVEGLPASGLGTIAARVEALLGRTVELFRLEDLPLEFVGRVEAEGRMLFPRATP